MEPSITAECTCISAESSQSVPVERMFTVSRVSVRNRALGVLAAVSVAGCGAPADRQDGAPAPMPGHPVYEATVRPDVEAGTLSAEWRYRFIVDERSAESVILLLSGHMDVERVAGDAVHGHRVEPFAGIPEWNQVVVELDSTVRTGEEVEVTIAYSGTPSFPPSGINSLTAAWVELNVDSGWHPFFATFDQLMTGVLRVQLPAHWGVVASGDSEFDGGVHVVRNAVPQLDVAFSAAPALDSLPAQGFTIFHRDADSVRVATALETATACAAYLNERYGDEEPLSDVRLVLVDRASSAYSRKNYITLSQFDPQDSVATSRFICHELAHRWSWGAGPLGPDHWLTEGFAEYVAARFVRHRFGEATFDSLIARWDERSRAMGPVWTPDMQGRGPDLLLYRKAPVVLSRLEERIGPAMFDRFLERYMTGPSRTTPELLDDLEEIAGVEARAALVGELGRAGDPSVTALRPD